jgi:hypothetical protein
MFSLASNTEENCVLLSTYRALSASITFKRCDQLCKLVFPRHVVSHDVLMRSRFL